MIYDARENALAHIRAEAEDLKADGVIGIKVFIYELGGGLVEVMAIGTAIRKHAGVRDSERSAHPSGHHPRPGYLLRLRTDHAGHGHARARTEVMRKDRSPTAQR